MDNPPTGARVALVVALVALAGCSGLFGAGSGAGETPDADDVTPAPVPGETATDGAGGPPFADPPPGIGPNGTVDPDRLGRAHDAVLANQSFTVRVRTNQVRAADGTVEYALAVRNESTYLVRDGTDGQSLVYVDPSGRFERSRTFRNGSAELTGEVTVRPPGDAPLVLGATAHLAARDPEVRRVERDGQTFYRLYSTTPPDVFEGASNYSVTAYVRPDGLVRTVDVTYDRQIGRGQSHVETRWTYTDVGSTTVVAPNWVRRAKRDPASRGSERYPPGVDADGLDQRFTLWNAHRFALERTSYTLVRSGNGAWSALPAPGSVTVENETTYFVSTGEETRYGDATGFYRLIATGEGESYVRVRGAQPYRLSATASHGAPWLVERESDVTRLERNGSTLFRLRITRPPDALDTDPANFTATALVRKSGVIERITVDATVPATAVDGADDENRTWVDVTYRYVYRDIGTTTVTEPAWVTREKRAQAGNATPDGTATATP